MAKQLNVNLAFQADTSGAKQQIEALSKSLKDIAKMPGSASSLFDDTEIKKASAAALELQQHLSKAVNTDTGKLDLSRFSSSLKASNKDLNTYCNTLLSTGEKGQQAFLQLAQAIATADAPVTRINRRLAEMGTTLKNTVRWQLSSSMLHGFMGAVQSAYGYAQDLNESLNNIRIVTGQNIDQMQKFAVEANRAAKALNTTTTEYTNASLIYYQQGLSDEEVAKRTEVTVKMANAAGESAEKISDQLTAVWNNFYDGSKSLEYYADVMTALGAATASSTDEIADGLEKFAAIGDTIGLSYEYAASALATITSNTRQSADVVGTALKTIFARIQGLSLGETLEDGVDLNKYSEALQKVGISIFDSNGELKKMDSILDEMGNKWDTLNNAQQVALAQTVAGVRQYNQLTSLMENWNNGDSDSMQANLATAYGSEGELQKQADIYAESWEAARDRVKAAAENIYDSLIDDDFFINLLNGFEKALESIGGFIDGLGGLKGIIMTIGSLFLTHFAQQMPTALNNLRQNFMVFTGQSKKVMSEMQSQLSVQLAEQQANPNLSESYKLQLEGISKVNQMKQKLVLASKNLTDQEKAEYQAKINNVEAMYKEIAALAEKKKAMEAAEAAASKKLNSNTTRNVTNQFSNYADQQNKITSLEQKATDPKASDAATEGYAAALEQARIKAAELDVELNKVAEVFDLSADDVDALINKTGNFAEVQKKVTTQVEATSKAFSSQIKQRSNLEAMSVSVKSQAKAWQNVAKEVKKAVAEGNTKGLSKSVDETKQKMQQYLGVLQKIAKENGMELSEAAIKSMGQAIDGINVDNIDEVTEKFSKFADTVSQKTDHAVDQLDASIDELRSDMSAMQFNESEINQLEQAATDAATANQELENSMSNIGGIADENVQGTFKMSVALTEFASVAMSVSSLINSVKSAISVFTDEGATGFEKVGAALSLLMPLMSSYNAIVAFGTTLKKFDTSAESENTLAKLGNAAGSKAAALAASLLGIGKTTETGAVIANTAAWYANPIMWIALIIVGVIAAIAGLIAAIVALTKTYNKDAIEAKKAADAAEELATKADEAAEAFESIKSAFENYDNLVNALNECTKGTDEWHAALKAVNDEVLSIIKNNPELAKKMQVERNADGMLTITNQPEILKQAETMANSASYAASMGAVTASQAQLKSDTTDLRRNIGTYTMGYGETASYFNAGEIISKHYEELAGLTAKEFETAIRELTSGAKQMYGATDYQYEQMINSLMGYQNEIDNLAIQANEAALQLENMANMVAEQELGEDYDAASKEIASEAYEEAYQEILEDAKKMGTENINRAEGKNNEDVIAFWNRYSQATGTNFSLSDNAVQGNDDNRYFEYLEDGEKKLISLEEAAAAIAATEALTAMGTAANEAANIIGGLSTKGQEFATGIANSKQADGTFDTANYLQDFTQAQLEAVKNGLNLEENTIDTNVLDMFGLSIDDFNTLAEQFGMTGQELMQALLDGANNALSSLTDEEILNLTNSNIDTSGLTIAQQKAFSAAKENAGQALIEASDNSINFRELRSIEDENTDAALKLTGFYNALAGVSLTSENATEQVQALVKEYGIEGAAVEDLISQVDALDKQFNISSVSINEQAAGLKEIADSLNTGDTISAEDIALLEQAGIDTSDYFSQMADGSFMLTAAAEEFKGLVESITFEALKDQLTDFENARKQAATGKWFDKYLTDTSVVEGSYTANSTGNHGNIGESADDLGRARLDYINQFEAGSFDFNDEQLQLLQDYQTNPELALTSEQLQQIANMIDIVNQSQSDLQAQMFTTATSLAELDAVAKELGTYDYSAYADGLINLASQYENCSDEIEEFQIALLTGSETAIKAAEDNLRAATIIGEAAEKYDLEAEVLEAQADRLADAYGISAEAAANMAVKNQRMNKGVSSLVDNWKDWKKQLSATDKLTEDYAEAVVDCTKAIADLVGASSDLELPDEFFNTENMALLERAVQGDIEAINALGAEVAWFTVDALEFNEAFATLASELESFNGFDVSGIDLSGILNADQFTADKNLVLQGITDIKNGLIAEGQSMGDDWVAALNRMALTTGMSVDQMNGLLGSLGVQAKVETTYVKQPMEVPTYTEKIEGLSYKKIEAPRYDENGEQVGTGYTMVPEYTKATVPGEPVTVEGYAAVAQISTEDNPMTVDINESVVGGNAPMTSRQSSGAASYSGTGSRGSVAPSAKEGSKNSGGGGDTKPAEKTETTKKEDIVDRYKELDDTLDDVADAYEDASKEADRLYGKARIDKIKQQNAYLQQEIGLLKDKIAAAKTYLAIDKQALDTAAQKAGVSFVYDEAGNLTNYTQQMEALYAELRAAQDAWNADYQNKTQEEQQEYEENILQPIQDKIDELKAAIAAYEETRELIEDLENQIDDKFYEWQDNNYEILHYGLEVEIELNDLELEYIDYYLNKIADDFYSMAEAAQYMNKKIPDITDSLSHYENFYHEITAAYAADEISQADYVEGMKESYSAILDQLSALNDLDKEMMNFYSDTLDAAAEELSYFTDQLSHHTEVLDHYRSIVELINGEFDYESIGIILQGATVTTKNEMDAAMANYQMLLSEKAALEASLAMAPDEAARELYEKELRAITEACIEAESEMLDKTEAWAQAMKAVLENTMAEAAHEMEMALTNSMTFNALNNSLDRLSSYADEYLTKTNQIYETQKLINTAQQVIDKTTNNAAKARLKSYQDEITALQQKNQLSQLELEIAQAQYDVLLAEIALEEAQNAKATVRLQRDSEGNYGYVYTADQEQVSQAEQDLLDAQNALYNIGLEGANEYGQKMLELKEKLANDLIDLEERRAQGEFVTLEAYEAERDRILQEYYALYTAYSEQYTTALEVDASIQEEAWVNAYESMITTTDDWKTAVTEYTKECEQAYTEWRQTVQTESETIDSILNHTEQEVKDVTSASNDLKNKVVNEVIPAIQNELQQVRAATSAYANQRAAIQQLINYYQQLVQEIYAAIAAQSAMSAASSPTSSPSSGSSGSSSSIGDANYATLMYEAYQAGKMDEYEYYKNLREQKIASTGNDYGVSTERLDDYITSGGTPDSGGWFTDEWLKKNGSLGTGGYTGAWGPEGRLALVHEKELMLNPDDTVNFLDAVNVVRSIAKTIDLEALRNQYSIMPVSPIYETQGVGETIQQQVQIEANFPNVSDRTEIEEAFNNLINTASQFANRKKL